MIMPQIRWTNSSFQATSTRLTSQLWNKIQRVKYIPYFFFCLHLHRKTEHKRRYSGLRNKLSWSFGTLRLLEVDKHVNLVTTRNYTVTYRWCKISNKTLTIIFKSIAQVRNVAKEKCQIKSHVLQCPPICTIYAQMSYTQS